MFIVMMKYIICSYKETADFQLSNQLVRSRNLPFPLT
uniref:Uncharacterized protein n=1 Tax=Lepeophtheirus salmonis TaxID=72036 RepID=A0A0K2TIU2_LEPSM